mmetsp:Transcript_25892/g.88600  ORF Transcript_25892/g.88600 Transcript_25892/m.88600 type:complete len:272 (-) Transcript_25892:436-1251(-)
MGSTWTSTHLEKAERANPTPLSWRDAPPSSGSGVMPWLCTPISAGVAHGAPANAYRVLKPYPNSSRRSSSPSVGAGSADEFARTPAVPNAESATTDGVELYGSSNLAYSTRPAVTSACFPRSARSSPPGKPLGMWSGTNASSAAPSCRFHTATSSTSPSKAAGPPTGHAVPTSKVQQLPPAASSELSRATYPSPTSWSSLRPVEPPHLLAYVSVAKVSVFSSVKPWDRSPAATGVLRFCGVPSTSSWPLPEASIATIAWCHAPGWYVHDVK